MKWLSINWPWNLYCLIAQRLSSFIFILTLTDTFLGNSSTKVIPQSQIYLIFDAFKEFLDWNFEKKLELHQRLESKINFLYTKLNWSFAQVWYLSIRSKTFTPSNTKFWPGSLKCCLQRPSKIFEKFEDRFSFVAKRETRDKINYLEGLQNIDFLLFQSYKYNPEICAFIASRSWKNQSLNGNSKKLSKFWSIVGLARSLRERLWLAEQSAGWKAILLGFDVDKR